GKSRFGFDYPAALALVELEQSPDERVRAGESMAPPPDEPAAEQEEAGWTPEPPSSAGELPLGPESTDASPRRALGKKPKAEGAWGTADAAVVLLAIGVLVLSALGA